MSGGGSGGGTTTVQKADPWEGQQPYLTGDDARTGIFPEAERLYNQGPMQFYPGQTYAGFSPESQLALAGQTQRAMQGSPLTDAAQSELQRTLSGEYLNASTNPYLMPLADQVSAEVLPRIQGRFEGSGLTGS